MIRTFHDRIRTDVVAVVVVVVVDVVVGDEAVGVAVAEFDVLNGERTDSASVTAAVGNGVANISVTRDN